MIAFKNSEVSKRKIDRLNRKNSNKKKVKKMRKNF